MTWGRTQALPERMPLVLHASSLSAPVVGQLHILSPGLLGFSRTWIEICYVCQYFSTVKNQPLCILPLGVRKSCKKAHRGESVKRARNLEDPSPCVTATLERRCRHPHTNRQKPSFLSGDTLEISLSRGCKLEAKSWKGLRDRWFCLACGTF